MRNKLFPVTAMALLALMLLPGLGLHAQKQKSSAELSKEIGSIENDIRKLEKLLSSTHSETSQSWNDLQLLQKQTQLQKNLIDNLNASAAALEAEIQTGDILIKSLEADIAKTKEEMKTLAVAIYKANYNKNKSYYIFNSRTVSQAYSRMRYFKELSNHLESQIKFLERTNAFLQHKKREQEVRKAEKLMAVMKEKLEWQKMAATQEAQRVLYESLKGQETQYRVQLVDRYNEKAKMDKMVQEAIKREIAYADSVAKAKRAKTPTSSGTQGTKPVAEAPGPKGEDVLLPLSKEFAENKGKLPWPIPSNQGIILNHFGRQVLPSGVEVDMNGVDITTSPNQKVRSVFQGKVLDIQELPLRGYHVVIGHGTYFTVYSNLREIFVTKGQEIDSLTPIGIAKTDKTSNETKVSFQIYQQFSALNPEQWLVAKD